MAGISKVIVRDIAEADWPAAIEIVRQVAAEGDSFAYPLVLDCDEARALWEKAPPGRNSVAVDPSDPSRLLGIAAMGANRPGPGDHIATASFMVSGDARGLGVGRTLVRDALDWARGQGFAGMQFNAVASSNRTAIDLYRSFGFEIVGTVPGAFRHPTEGAVDLHIMFIDFRTEPGPGRSYSAAGR